MDDARGVVYHAEVSSIVMPDTITVSDTLSVTLVVLTTQGVHGLSYVGLDRSPNRIAVQVFGVVSSSYAHVMGSYSADIEVYPVDLGVFTVAVIQPDYSIWEEIVIVVAE